MATPYFNPVIPFIPIITAPRPEETNKTVEQPVQVRKTVELYVPFEFWVILLIFALMVVAIAWPTKQRKQK